MGSKWNGRQGGLVMSFPDNKVEVDRDTPADEAELDGSTRLAILRLEWALNSLRGTAAPEDVTSAIRQIVLAKAELEQGIGWYLGRGWAGVAEVVS